MSEERHGKKWGVPLEEVAGKTAGRMVDYEDFENAELFANIKRGMEVPLSGVASMPEVIRKARDLRLEQDKRARDWIQTVKDAVNNGSELSEDEKLSAIATAEHEVRRQLMTPKARTRYDFAATTFESITRHLLTETASVEGKRAEQTGELVKAIVLHEEDTFEKLYPQKKRRSLLHPLGESR